MISVGMLFIAVFVGVLVAVHFARRNNAAAASVCIGGVFGLLAISYFAVFPILIYGRPTKNIPNGQYLVYFIQYHQSNTEKDDGYYVFAEPIGVQGQPPKYPREPVMYDIAQDGLELPKGFQAGDSLHVGKLKVVSVKGFRRAIYTPIFDSENKKFIQ